MKVKRTIMILVALTLTMFCGCYKKEKVSMQDKPAIVMVAFGTSVPEARRVFDYIDSKVKEKYSGYNVRWAFTSEFIIDKLKKQGVVTKNLSQVVADLKKEGYKSAVFQSLHIVPGQEFKEIDTVDTSGLKVAVGKALLSNDEDIVNTINALQANIDASAVNILAGHGNDHHPEFNAQLVAFAKKIESQYPNVFVCSVEGQPGTDKLNDAKEMAVKTGSVNYIPLMVVAGDHIINDVMGDEADSWKSIVAAKENSCAKSLGFNDRVIDVYLEHLKQALMNVEK